MRDDIHGKTTHEKPPFTSEKKKKLVPRTPSQHPFWILKFALCVNIVRNTATSARHIFIAPLSYRKLSLIRTTLFSGEINRRHRSADPSIGSYVHDRRTILCLPCYSWYARVTQSVLVFFGEPPCALCMGCLDVYFAFLPSTLRRACVLHAYFPSVDHSA